MYEPYALSCGHTYCYTCLSQWLGSNRKKTCPDCRTVITQQPTPSYIIREMVLIFMGRNELLPDGETSDEHQTMAKEEADLVAKDKANEDPRTGGLFKGSFKRGGDGMPLLPMYDPGDGVERCPVCHWEVEDGYCNQCGQPVGDGLSEFDSDSVTTDDELDRALDELDGHPGFEVGYDGFPIEVDDFDDTDEEDNIDPNLYHAAFGAAPRARPAGLGARRPRAPIAISSDMSEDESEDEDEHDPSMEGFIGNDEFRSDEPGHGGIYDDDSDDTEVQAVRNPRSRPRAQVVISDDEDGEQATRAGAISVDDSEDEGPIAAPSQRNKRSRTLPRQRQRPIAISSDEESFEEESEAHQEPESVIGGFSPLQTMSGYGEDGISEHYGAMGYVDPVQFGHSEDSEESPSDNDGDSDNGWGSGTTTANRPEHPLTTVTGMRSDAALVGSSRGARHRLQTGNQRRIRHTNASLAGPLHRSPTVVIPSRFDGSARNLDQDRASHSSHAATGAGPSANRRRQPDHPFQLDNTLAGINRNQSRQQRRHDVPISPSIESSVSSTGGVDINSSASVSSSDSSRTIGPDTAGPSGARKRDYGRFMEQGRFAEAYDGYDDDGGEDEDEDEDEY